VSKLEFEPSLEANPNFKADALVGNTVFEVLADLRDLRRFRSTLVEFTKNLSADSRLHGVLVLDEPLIGADRLRDEWFSIMSLLRPEIVEGITLVIRRVDNPILVFGALSDTERNYLNTVAEHARQSALHPIRRSSEAFFDILRVLLVSWFRKSGPLTSKQLTEQTGFSYPTIASALERLDTRLIRHSDRRIELSAFPKEAWFKLVAQVEKVRSSQGFMAPSAHLRPPEVLLDRLRDLGREDIAVAGVLGARHYLPGLDVVGTPRLDLVVHASRMDGPPTFLRRLDPALKPAGRGEPCQVVIHTLFRPESLFSQPENGICWADEVECLLDLHEMRLEAQALEFVERLNPKAKP
jgi:hypothetical protein